MSFEQEHPSQTTAIDAEIENERESSIITFSTNCYFPPPPPPSSPYFCDCSCLARKVVKTHLPQHISDVATDVDNQKESKKQVEEKKAEVEEKKE